MEDHPDALNMFGLRTGENYDVASCKRSKAEEINGRG